MIESQRLRTSGVPIGLILFLYIDVIEGAYLLARLDFILGEDFFGLPIFQPALSSP